MGSCFTSFQMQVRAVGIGPDRLEQSLLGWGLGFPGVGLWV